MFHPKQLIWLFVSILFFTQVSAQEMWEFDDWYETEWSEMCEWDEYSDAPGGHFWFDTEYLYWKIKDSPVPVPLVVKGVVGSPAFFGAPGTSVKIGKENFEHNWRSGVKATIGYWFDDEECLGADISYFFVPNGSKSKSTSSNGQLGSALLIIPFNNVLTGRENATGLAIPGSFEGEATLKIVNRMQGAECNGLLGLPCYYGVNVTALLGFRYWTFNEHLTFTTSSPFIAFPTDVFKTTDKFDVDNNFYGGQLGLFLEYIGCDYFVSLEGKVAFGTMYSEVSINGNLVTNDFTGFGPTLTFPGGYFALPTNIGTYRTSKFAAIPEVNLNFGYRLMDCLELQIGYSFLYASNVFWSGKQIDRTINPTQAPSYSGNPTETLAGEARPKALKKRDDLWAQGLNAGIVFRY